MLFHLDDEQEMIANAMRRLVGDLAGRRRAAVDTEKAFDLPSWEALMAAGVGAMMLPAALNGGDTGALEAALAFECIGEGAVPGPFVSQLLVGVAIALHGNKALVERWAADLGAGRMKGLIVLRSPESLGTDWPIAANDRVSGVVDAVPGTVGTDVILLETADDRLVVLDARDRGVSLHAVAGSDLTRGLVSLILDEAPFHELSADGVARERLRDLALILIAADALGGAQACLDRSVAYAQTRHQFGRVIGSFQAVKYQLARMAVEVETGRPLLWYAAHAWDAALPDAPRAAAHAKAHLTDRFVSVARAAIELHGGYGYTWECDLHLWLRRSLFDRAYLGGPSIHRERAAKFGGW
jgi:alkylation response protein AidB-like acyl-CoA dehydrogenase